MKRSFFQTAVVSILLYGCTTWTRTKRLEKKLDGKYTRMLLAILNKSWRQHSTKHQLYGHQPLIAKTIQVRRSRHAGHCWRSRDQLISDVLWAPTYGPHIWPPHLVLFTVMSSSCNALVVPFQELLEGPMEVLVWVRQCSSSQTLSSPQFPHNDSLWA